MRALLLALILVLVACAPAVRDERAPGVTLTSTQHETYVTYRVDAREPLERLFLRFTGEDLEVNATECLNVDGAIECVVGAVESFYEVSVAGTVTIPDGGRYGIACRASGCYWLYLSD